MKTQMSRTFTGSTHTITGGTRPNNGPNLFHSFDRFSIGTGDTVTFTGPAGIANILSRVTGGQRSEIDGRLQSTIPGANLFLLNPSGVLFGPNASLAVSGSFHVSTADVLRFADEAKFFTSLGQASVLTVASPAAFGFLGSDPAPITLQGLMIAVPTGRAVSVVGGDITMAGGTLQAAAGQLQLVSVASPSAVLTIWLCNGVSQFALVVGADALHEFRHCEHASGFHNGPFPMHPLGLNGIEPGTLAR
jgi:filamentous hemagglutinin family protein